MANEAPPPIPPGALPFVRRAINVHDRLRTPRESDVVRKGFPEEDRLAAEIAAITQFADIRDSNAWVRARFWWAMGEAIRQKARLNAKSWDTWGSVDPYVIAGHARISIDARGREDLRTVGKGSPETVLAQIEDQRPSILGRLAGIMRRGRR